MCILNYVKDMSPVKLDNSNKNVTHSLRELLHVKANTMACGFNVSTVHESKCNRKCAVISEDSLTTSRKRAR